MSLNSVIFYRTQVRSLAYLVIESLSALDEFCSNWIIQSCYMDLSRLLDRFVRIDTWISQSCYRDLSKLIHGPQETLLTLWWSVAVCWAVTPFIRENTRD